MDTILFRWKSNIIAKRIVLDVLKMQIFPWYLNIHLVGGDNIYHKLYVRRFLPMTGDVDAHGQSYLSASDPTTEDTLHYTWLKISRKGVKKFSFS